MGRCARVSGWLVGTAARWLGWVLRRGAARGTPGQSAAPAEVLRKGGIEHVHQPATMVMGWGSRLGQYNDEEREQIQLAHCRKVLPDPSCWQAGSQSWAAVDKTRTTLPWITSQLL